ncbi:MAG: hemerythrin domain-containing protein [Acidihalobacter sp.]
MLFPTPASGFDDPLGVLAGCHRRIAGFCDTLERLESHLKSAGADTQAGDAARRIYDYFEKAGPQHHADEEVDLLPMLQRRARSEAERAAVADWEARTGTEHLAQDKAWRRLREELLAVMEGRGAAVPSAAEFVALQREHFRFEDMEVFPLARDLLTDADLAALGRAMARRRGVERSQDRVT